MKLLPRSAGLNNRGRSVLGGRPQAGPSEFTFSIKLETWPEGHPLGSSSAQFPLYKRSNLVMYTFFYSSVKKPISSLEKASFVKPVSITPLLGVYPMYSSELLPPEYA